MYLHIGQGIVVTHESIIGIFDLDNTTSSYITRDYLSRAEKSGRVIALGDELPNSFVVIKEKETETETIYLSQLSAATLTKRSAATRID